MRSKVYRLSDESREHELVVTKMLRQELFEAPDRTGIAYRVGFHKGVSVYGSRREVSSLLVGSGTHVVMIQKANVTHNGRLIACEIVNGQVVFTPQDPGTYVVECVIGPQTTSVMCSANGCKREAYVDGRCLFHPKVRY